MRPDTKVDLQDEHGKRRCAAKCHDVDKETPSAECEALSGHGLAEEAAPDECCDADRVRSGDGDNREGHDGIKAHNWPEVDEGESAGECDRDPYGSTRDLVVVDLRIISLDSFQRNVCAAEVVERVRRSLEVDDWCKISTNSSDSPALRGQSSYSPGLPIDRCTRNVLTGASDDAQGTPPSLAKAHSCRLAVAS